MTNDRVNLLDEECVICLDTPISAKAYCFVNCGHAFHRKCIKKWFELSKQNRCPLCKVGSEIVTVVRKKKQPAPEKRRKSQQNCCFWFFC